LDSYISYPSPITATLNPSHHESSQAGLDLIHRTDHELLQDAFYLDLVGGDARGLKIADNLGNDIFIARFL